MTLIDKDALIEKLEAWKKEAERRDANINYTFASAIIAQVNAEPTIEERKWIPCSERLPQKDKQVLCCNKRGSVYTSAYTYTDSRGVAVFGQHLDVIAWMPLPEPYKEGHT